MNQQGKPPTPPPTGKPPARFQPPRAVLMLLLAFALIFLMTTFLNKSMPAAEKRRRSAFFKDLRAGHVKSVEIGVRQTEVTLYPMDDEKPTRYTFPVTSMEDQNSIGDKIGDYNKGVPSDKYVDYDQVPENRLVGFLLTVIAPTAILLLLLYFIFFRSLSKAGGSSILSFGKSRARMAVKGQIKVTFDDVAGIEEAKQEVKEIIEFLKNPEKFNAIGARIPRGVLLVGAPGTGKTLLAKAIAGQADVPFFSISGSDFVEMFVGVGASRVRDLFRQAKESAPCIIFLDEVDAVGRKRGAAFSGGGHDEREQTLNAILVEMDGFESDVNVVVIAATNRPDVLDPALRRPGRFDRLVMVDMPDVKGREEILKVHARKIVLEDSVDLGVVARGTPNFTGADLEAIINEAAILAVLENRKEVLIEDLEEARDKVRWGRQRRSRVMALEDKRITAFHESGHAVATTLLPEVEPLHKVTIIPRGMALGATMHLPEKDKYHVQRKELLGEIVALLAGRVSEEMFCSDISSGARNDIQRATSTARFMVREWGMSSKLGPIFYGEENSENGYEPVLIRPYSESTAVEIDAEVKAIINQCYERAQALLTKHRENIERVANALLEREVLDAAEVDLLMSGGSLPEVKDVASGAGGEDPPTGKTQEPPAVDEG